MRDERHPSEDDVSVASDLSSWDFCLEYVDISANLGHATGEKSSIRHRLL